MGKYVGEDEGPVTDVESFERRWDSRHNFRLGVREIAPGFGFVFPPTDHIITAMLALDSTAAVAAQRRQLTEYALPSEARDQLPRFRSMSRAELMGSTFNLRRSACSAFSTPIIPH
jgi:hypothetical protein